MRINIVKELNKTAFYMFVDYKKLLGEDEDAPLTKQDKEIWKLFFEAVVKGYNLGVYDLMSCIDDDELDEDEVETD